MVTIIALLSGFTMASFILVIFSLSESKKVKEKLQLRTNNANRENDRLKRRIDIVENKYGRLIRFMEMSDEELDKRIEIYENLNIYLKVTSVNPEEVWTEDVNTKRVTIINFSSFLKTTDCIYRYEKKKIRSK